MGGRPSRGTPGGSQRLWRPMAKTIRGVGEEWYAVSDVVINVCVVMRDVQQKPEGLEQSQAGHHPVSGRSRLPESDPQSADDDVVKASELPASPRLAHGRSRLPDGGPQRKAARRVQTSRLPDGGPQSADDDVVGAGELPASPRPKLAAGL